MQATRLPFFCAGAFGKLRADIALVVGSDALEAADRDGLGLGLIVLFDPSAPAGRFAGPIAGAAENAGEDVRLPVDHVGVAVTTRGDHPDVFRNGGMGRTRPLAVHDLVEIVGYRNIGGLQKVLLPLGACLRNCYRPPDPISSELIRKAGSWLPKLCVV